MAQLAYPLSTLSISLPECMIISQLKYSVSYEKF